MKRLTLAVILQLFLLSTVPAQTGSALFQEGRDAFSDKLFSRAVESFREFIDRYPGDPRIDQADYMIGVSYFYLKRFSDAIAHFNTYERNYPGSAYLKRIHYWKGLSYYADGAYRQAIGEFRRQTEFEEELYFLQKSYQFLGYTYEKTNDPDAAVQAYQDLIDLKPEKTIAAQAMERQGVIHLNQGDYERALSLFTRITIDYRDIPQMLREVTFYMGESYYQLGDQENSIQKFETFLSLYAASENREKAIFRLGSLYALRDNQDAAKEYMHLLNSEYPRSEYRMDAHIVLAESYLKSGDFETARNSLNTLLESESDPVEIQKIQYNLARTWQDEPDEALKWYLMAAKGLDPDLASESLYQSGRLYDERGEKERTILLYERLFNQYKESPHRELVGDWMAVYYDRNAQDLALKNHLDRMLQEYPETKKRVLYLYMRGNIAYRDGDYNSSLRFYQNVLNVERENRTLLNETRYRIGYIYTLRKEFNRAKGYFQQILDNGEEGELYYRALLSIGISSLNILETEEAAAVFTRITEAENAASWKGDAYHYLGQIAMEQGNYYRAADNFVLAVEASRTPSRRADSLYQLGWSRLRLTRFAEAAESFDTLARDYPNHKLAAESLYRAGIAYSYLEEWEASLERFHPALEQIEYASLREELIYQIAWSYFMMEDFSSAMDSLAVLQQEFPDSPLPPDGLFRAAEALQEKGRTASAVFSYKQVFQLFPDSPLSETSLFRALSFTDNLGDSLVLMKEYLMSYPSLDKAHQIAAQIDSRIRNLSLSAREAGLIDEILSLPLDNEVRAVILLSLYSQSLEDEETWGKLTELESMEGLREEERKRILLYKGIHHYHAGRQETAQEAFEALLDDIYTATAAEAQFYLALILNQQGRWKDAADAFLRIRYRYPEQKVWVSRGLYEASRSYRNAGDFDSYSRAAEMLQSEFPESEWTGLLMEIDPPAASTPSPDGHGGETDPDLLSPPEELLPIFDGA